VAAGIPNGSRPARRSGSTGRTGRSRGQAAPGVGRDPVRRGRPHPASEPNGPDSALAPSGDGAPRQGVLDWVAFRDRLRSRGLRWTPQRRRILQILVDARGHLTGAELVARCRRVDPDTIPSTVYRTLDVLEELGIVRHAHGPDGREEYHILPERDHGHLYCEGCGRSWEIDLPEAEPLLRALAAGRGFVADLSHLSIVGRCADCRDGGRR
jgi:Fur family ferric uptake transcriptional regulator